jgi:hypothetical protein
MDVSFSVAFWLRCWVCFEGERGEVRYTWLRARMSFSSFVCMYIWRWDGSGWMTLGLRASERAGGRVYSTVLGWLVQLRVKVEEEWYIYTYIYYTYYTTYLLHIPYYNTYFFHPIQPQDIQTLCALYIYTYLCTYVPMCMSPLRQASSSGSVRNRWKRGRSLAWDYLPR